MEKEAGPIILQNDLYYEGKPYDHGVLDQFSKLKSN